MLGESCFDKIMNYAIPFAIVFLFGIVALIVVAVVTMPPPLERYQAAYNNCMAEETLSPEQCHDIALMTAFGSGAKTNSVPVPIILPR